MCVKLCVVCACMLFEGVLNLQVCARVSGCGVGVSVDVDRRV